jgi:hypothetical protein
LESTVAALTATANDEIDVDGMDDYGDEEESRPLKKRGTKPLQVPRKKR